MLQSQNRVGCVGEMFRFQFKNTVCKIYSMILSYKTLLRKFHEVFPAYELAELYHNLSLCWLRAYQDCGIRENYDNLEITKSCLQKAIRTFRIAGGKSFRYDILLEAESLLNEVLAASTKSKCILSNVTNSKEKFIMASIELGRFDQASELLIQLEASAVQLPEEAHICKQLRFRLDNAIAIGKLFQLEESLLFVEPENVELCTRVFRDVNETSDFVAKWDCGDYGHECRVRVLKESNRNSSINSGETELWLSMKTGRESPINDCRLRLPNNKVYGITDDLLLHLMNNVLLENQLTSNELIIRRLNHAMRGKGIVLSSKICPIRLLIASLDNDLKTETREYTLFLDVTAVMKSVKSTGSNTQTILRSTVNLNTKFNGQVVGPRLISFLNDVSHERLVLSPSEVVQTLMHCGCFLDSSGVQLRFQCDRYFDLYKQLSALYATIESHFLSQHYSTAMKNVKSLSPLNPFAVLVQANVSHMMSEVFERNITSAVDFGNSSTYTRTINDNVLQSDFLNVIVPRIMTIPELHKTLHPVLVINWIVVDAVSPPQEEANWLSVDYIFSALASDDGLVSGPFVLSTHVIYFGHSQKWGLLLPPTTGRSCNGLFEDLVCSRPEIIPVYEELVRLSHEDCVAIKDSDSEFKKRIEVLLNIAFQPLLLSLRESLPVILAERQDTNSWKNCIHDVGSTTGMLLLRDSLFAHRNGYHVNIRFVSWSDIGGFSTQNFQLLDLGATPAIIKIGGVENDEEITFVLYYLAPSTSSAPTWTSTICHFSEPFGRSLEANIFKLMWLGEERMLFTSEVENSFIFKAFQMNCPRHVNETTKSKEQAAFFAIVKDKSSYGVLAVVPEEASNKRSDDEAQEIFHIHYGSSTGSTIDLAPLHNFGMRYAYVNSPISSQIDCCQQKMDCDNSLLHAYLNMCALRVLWRNQLWEFGVKYLHLQLLSSVENVDRIKGWLASEDFSMENLNSFKAPVELGGGTMELVLRCFDGNNPVLVDIPTNCRDAIVFCSDVKETIDWLITTFLTRYEQFLSLSRLTESHLIFHRFLFQGEMTRRKTMCSTASPRGTSKHVKTNLSSFLQREVPAILKHIIETIKLDLFAFFSPHADELTQRLTSLIKTPTVDWILIVEVIERGIFLERFSMFASLIKSSMDTLNAVIVSDSQRLLKAAFHKPDGNLDKIVSFIDQAIRCASWDEVFALVKSSEGIDPPIDPCIFAEFLDTFETYELALQLDFPFCLKERYVTSTKENLNCFHVKAFVYHNLRSCCMAWSKKTFQLLEHKWMSLSTDEIHKQIMSIGRLQLSAPFQRSDLTPPAILQFDRGFNDSVKKELKLLAKSKRIQKMATAYVNKIELIVASILCSAIYDSCCAFPYFVGEFRQSRMETMERLYGLAHESFLREVEHVANGVEFWFCDKDFPVLTSSSSRRIFLKVARKVRKNVYVAKFYSTTAQTDIQTAEFSLILPKPKPGLVVLEHSQVKAVLEHCLYENHQDRHANLKLVKFAKRIDSASDLNELIDGLFESRTQSTTSPSCTLSLVNPALEFRDAVDEMSKNRCGTKIYFEQYLQYFDKMVSCFTKLHQMLPSLQSALWIGYGNVFESVPSEQIQQQLQDAVFPNLRPDTRLGNVLEMLDMFEFQLDAHRNLNELQSLFEQSPIDSKGEFACCALLRRYMLETAAQYIDSMLAFRETSNLVLNEFQIRLSSRLSSYYCLNQRGVITPKLQTCLAVIESSHTYSEKLRAFQQTIEMIAESHACFLLPKNIIQSTSDLLEISDTQLPAISRLNKGHRLTDIDRRLGELRVLLLSFTKPLEIEVDLHVPIEGRMLITCFANASLLSEILEEAKLVLRERQMRSLQEGDELRVIGCDAVFLDVDMVGSLFRGVNVVLQAPSFEMPPDRSDQFTLQTSGSNAENFKQPALSGVNDSSDENEKRGEDGLTGLPGGHAGNVLWFADDLPEQDQLIVEANGGNGGKGQSGGCGGRGKDGSDGVDGSNNGARRNMRHLIKDGKLTTACTDYYSGVCIDLGTAGDEGDDGGDCGYSGYGGNFGNKGLTTVRKFGSSSAEFLYLSKNGMEGEEADTSRVLPGMPGKHGRDGKTTVMTANICRMHDFDDNHETSSLKFFKGLCFDSRALLAQCGYHTNTPKQKENKTGFVYLHKGKTYGTCQYAEPYCEFDLSQDESRTRSRYHNKTRRDNNHRHRDNQRKLATVIHPINAIQVFQQVKTYLECICSQDKDGYMFWQARKVSKFLNHLSQHFGESATYAMPSLDSDSQLIANIRSQIMTMVSQAVQELRDAENVLTLERSSVGLGVDALRMGETAASQSEETENFNIQKRSIIVDKSEETESELRHGLQLFAIHHEVVETGPFVSPSQTCTWKLTNPQECAMKALFKHTSKATTTNFVEKMDVISCYEYIHFISNDISFEGKLTVETLKLLFFRFLRRHSRRDVLYLGLVALQFTVEQANEILAQCIEFVDTETVGELTLSQLTREIFLYRCVTRIQCILCADSSVYHKDTKSVVRVFHWLNAFFELSHVAKVLESFHGPQRKMEKCLIMALFEDTLQNCFPWMWSAVKGSLLSLQAVDVEYLSMLYNRIHQDVKKMDATAAVNELNLVDSSHLNAVIELLSNSTAFSYFSANSADCLHVKQLLSETALTQWPDLLQEIELSRAFAVFLDRNNLAVTVPLAQECLLLLNSLCRLRVAVEQLIPDTNQLQTLEVYHSILSMVVNETINLSVGLDILSKQPPSLWLARMSELEKVDSLLTVEPVQSTLDSIVEQLQECIVSKETINISSLKSTAMAILAGVDQFQQSFPNEQEPEIRRMIQAAKDGGCHVVPTFIALACAYRSAHKMKPRYTQLVTVLMFVKYKTATRGWFAQIKTGEGKTLIVAFISAYFGLCGKKVDVLSSNSDLARDGEKKSSSFFQLCGLTSGHVAHFKEDDRRAAYKHVIVYGDIAAFQGDILDSEFNAKDIVGDRYAEMCQACLIGDEVDSICLDKAKTVLYLSHCIDGLKWLEFLFLYIWGVVLRTSTQGEKELEAAVEEIRLCMLSALASGDVFCPNHMKPVEFNVNLINGPPTRPHPEKKQINLITLHKVDAESYVADVCTAEDKSCRLRLNDLLDFEDLNLQQLPWSEPKEFAARSKMGMKIVSFIKSNTTHANNFIERKLPVWIKNAFHAKVMSVDNDFVIDHSPEDTKSERKKIVILDKDVGVEQYSSKWSNGLSQFLELKYRRKLSVESLKAVFMSNMEFVLRYGPNLYGVTGTLGNQPSQKFLSDIYKTDLFFVPTAYPKQFRFVSPCIATNPNDWTQFIVTSATQMTISRPVLIICESVEETSLVVSAIKAFGVGEDRLRIYARDKDQLDHFVTNPAKAGDIIVATNKGGRGTDIMVSRQANSSGGLHVILTYVPSNARIEEQAFGRTSRNGMPGSGQYIVSVSTTKDLMRQISNLQQEKRMEKLTELAPGHITELKLRRDKAEEAALVSLTQVGVLRIEIENELLKSFKKFLSKTLSKFDSAIKTYLKSLPRKLIGVINNGYSEICKYGLLREAMHDAGGCAAYSDLGENELKQKVNKDLVKGQMKQDILKYLSDVLKDHWALWLDTVQEQIQKAECKDVAKSLETQFINEVLNPTYECLISANTSALEESLLKLVKFPEQALKLGQLFLRHGDRNRAKYCFRRSLGDDPIGMSNLGLAYCEIPPDGGSRNSDSKLKKKVRRHLKDAKEKMDCVIRALSMNVEISNQIAKMTKQTEISRSVSDLENFYVDQVKEKLSVFGMHNQLLTRYIGSNLDQDTAFATKPEEYDKARLMYYSLVDEGILYHNRIRRRFWNRTNNRLSGEAVKLLEENFDISLVSPIHSLLNSSGRCIHIKQSQFEAIARDKTEFWELLQQSSKLKEDETTWVLDLKTALEGIPAVHVDACNDVIGRYTIHLRQEKNRVEDPIKKYGKFPQLIRLESSNEVVAYGRQSDHTWGYTSIRDGWKVANCGTSSLPAKERVFLAGDCFQLVAVDSGFDPSNKLPSNLLPNSILRSDSKLWFYHLIPTEKGSIPSCIALKKQITTKGKPFLRSVLQTSSAPVVAVDDIHSYSVNLLRSIPRDPPPARSISVYHSGRRYEAVLTDSLKGCEVFAFEGDTAKMVEALPWGAQVVQGATGQGVAELLDYLHSRCSSTMNYNALIDLLAGNNLFSLPKRTVYYKIQDNNLVSFHYSEKYRTPFLHACAIPPEINIHQMDVLAHTVGAIEDPVFALDFTQSNHIACSVISTNSTSQLIHSLIVSSRAHHFQTIDRFNVDLKLFDNESKKKLLTHWTKSDNPVLSQKKRVLIGGKDFLLRVEQAMASDPCYDKYKNITYYGDCKNEGILGLLRDLVESKSKCQEVGISHYLYESDFGEVFKSREQEAKIIIGVLRDLNILKAGGLMGKKINEHFDLATSLGIEETPKVLNKYAHKELKETLELCVPEKCKCVVSDLVALQGDIRSFQDGLKGWFKRFEELDPSQGGGGEISGEMSFYAPLGFHRPLVIEEYKRWHFNLAAFLVLVLGVLQVIAGAVLCSIGFPNLGAALIGEGISDMVQGTIGLITGEFDLTSWAIGKAISFTVSMLTCGAAAFKAMGTTARTIGTLTKCQVFVKELAKAGAAFIVDLSVALVSQFVIGEMMTITQEYIASKIRPLLTEALKEKKVAITAKLSTIYRTKGRIAYREAVRKLEDDVRDVINNKGLANVVRHLKSAVNAALNIMKQLSRSVPSAKGLKQKLAEQAMREGIKLAMYAAVDSLVCGIQVKNTISGVKSCLQESIDSLDGITVQSGEVAEENVPAEVDAEIERMSESLVARVTEDVVGVIGSAANGALQLAGGLAGTALSHVIDKKLSAHFERKNQNTNNRNSIDLEVFTRAISAEETDAQQQNGRTNLVDRPENVNNGQNEGNDDELLNNVPEGEARSRLRTALQEARNHSESSPNDNSRRALQQWTNDFPDLVPLVFEEVGYRGTNTTLAQEAVRGDLLPTTRFEGDPHWNGTYVGELNVAAGYNGQQHENPAMLRVLVPRGSIQSALRTPGDINGFDPIMIGGAQVVSGHDGAVGIETRIRPDLAARAVVIPVSLDDVIRNLRPDRRQVTEIWENAQRRNEMQ